MDVAPHLTVVKTVKPALRKAGVKVRSAAELIAKLKDEAGANTADLPGGFANA